MNEIRRQISASRCTVSAGWTGGQVQVRQVAAGVAMRTGRLVMAVPAETAVMSTFRCNRNFPLASTFTHPLRTISFAYGFVSMQISAVNSIEF